MSLVLKIPLISVAAIGAWYALTPPQPPPRVQERVKSEGVERSFGNVVRMHAHIWKVGKPSMPSFPVGNGSLTWFVVLCTRESPRRVRRLCIRRIVHSLATPLLLPQHIDNTTVAPTHLDITRGVRARVSDDGRERRAPSGVLQGDGPPLHIRAHLALES
jgi:hypothetical protein